MAGRGKKGKVGDVAEFYCSFLKRRVKHVLVEIPGNPHPPKYFWKCTKENCKHSRCDRLKYARVKQVPSED
jgi:hypothetical protein